MRKYYKEELQRLREERLVNEEQKEREKRDKGSSMSFWWKKKEEKVESNNKEPKVVVNGEELELEEYIKRYTKDFTEKERDAFSTTYYGRLGQLKEEARILK